MKIKKDDDGELDRGHLRSGRPENRFKGRRRFFFLIFYNSKRAFGKRVHGPVERAIRSLVFARPRAARGAHGQTGATGLYYKRGSQRSPSSGVCA